MLPTKHYDLGLKDLVKYRPHTGDEDIIRAILIDRSEYLLFAQCQPKVIFDVGANIGATSILLANSYPNATIYAFEPEPENFSLLTENIKAYPNVKIFNCALGDRTGIRNLLASEDDLNFGGYSFYDEGSDPEKKITVEVQSIRNFCKHHEIEKIDLMKIDTEGSEHEILGALYYSSHGPNLMPEYIMGEVHGVDDWRLFTILSETHDLRINKDFKQRCYPFYAARKTNAPTGT